MCCYFIIIIIITLFVLKMTAEPTHSLRWKESFILSQIKSPMALTLIKTTSNEFLRDFCSFGCWLSVGRSVGRPVSIGDNKNYSSTYIRNNKNFVAITTKKWETDWFNPTADSVFVRYTLPAVTQMIFNTTFSTKIRKLFKMMSDRVFVRIDLPPNWSRCDLIQSVVSVIWFMGCHHQDERKKTNCLKCVHTEKKNNIQRLTKYNRPQPPIFRIKRGFSECVFF